MGRHRRIWTLGWAALVVTLAMAACSPPSNNSGSTGTTGSGGDNVNASTVTMALPGNLYTMNPLATFRGTDTVVLSLIQDTLLVADPDATKYQPRLADSWTVSKDATTFTFQLHKGLKWSDGQPFTSKDVLFTFNTTANPKVASPQSTRLASIAGYADMQSGKATTLSGLKALDDLTVEFKLSSPDAGFLSTLAAGMYFFILPEHVLEKVAPEKIMTDPYWFNPTVSLGPFTWVSYHADQRVVLKRNPAYRLPVKFGQMILPILSPDVATGQLGTGEVDIASVDPLQVDTVKASNNVNVVIGDSGGFNRYAINIRKPYLQDYRVRQAMMYALDRKGMLKGVLNGYGTIINSAFMTKWAMPSDLINYDYNPDKARALLQAAGWDFSRELVLTLTPNQKTVVTITQQNFEKIGLKTKVVPIDPRGTSPLVTGNYDLYLFGGGIYEIDPATEGPILTCDAVYPKGGNISGYCNPELDALMKQGTSAADQGTRAKYYKQAVQIENKEVPYLITARSKQIIGVNKRISGYRAWPDASLIACDVAKWEVK